MQMKKQPPAQLETLQDLLKEAEHYSEVMMSGDIATVPLTLMILAPEGLLLHRPWNSNSNPEKDNFAQMARIAAVAYKATAVAVIAESWVAGLDHRVPDKLVNYMTPAESPDRKEVVWINAESHDSTITRFLFIERDTFGNFCGFAPSLLPDECSKTSGRFAGLMPQHEVTDKEALAARSLMQSMGAIVNKTGSALQLN
jgi:hypothetical protein